MYERSLEEVSRYRAAVLAGHPSVKLYKSFKIYDGLCDDLPAFFKIRPFDLFIKKKQ